MPAGSSELWMGTQDTVGKAARPTSVHGCRGRRGAGPSLPTLRSQLHPKDEGERRREEKMATAAIERLLWEGIEEGRAGYIYI